MKKRYFALIICLIAMCFLGCYIYKNYLPYKGELIVIKGTNVFHRNNCKFVKDTDVTKYILIADFRTAAKKNLRPCKTCNPIKEKEFEQYKLQSKQAELWEYVNGDMARYAKLNEEGKRVFKEYALSNNLLTESQIRELETLKPNNDTILSDSILASSTKGNPDKVKIVSTSKESNLAMYNVLINVKNEDDYSHNVIAQVLFYDKKGNLLKVQETSLINIKSDDIVTLETTDYSVANQIYNYKVELKIDEKYPWQS